MQYVPDLKQFFDPHEKPCYWCGKPITDGTGQVVCLNVSEITFEQRIELGRSSGTVWAPVHEYCHTQHKQ